MATQGLRATFIGGTSTGRKVGGFLSVMKYVGMISTCLKPAKYRLELGGCPKLKLLRILYMFLIRGASFLQCSTASQFHGSRLSMPAGCHQPQGRQAVSMAVATQLAKPQPMRMGQVVRIGVLGASGYTGAEVRDIVAVLMIC